MFFSGWKCNLTMKIIHHPKILIINTDSIMSNNATGITMRSIFSHFSTNNWLEITCHPDSEDKIINGVKFYSLPKKYYPLHWLLRFSFFKKMNKESKMKCIQENIRKGENNLSHIIRKLIISYSDSFFLLPPIKLLKIVKEFDPDYIYTLGASNLVMKLALYFSKKTNKSIIMHFMDNWVETLYADNILLKPCRLIMKRLLKKVYEKMDQGLTISEYMAEEYTKKWKIKHIPLMNTVSRIMKNPSVAIKQKVFNITYAGGLHLDRWRSLMQVKDVLSELNKKNEDDRQIHLHIYTSKNNREVYSEMLRSDFCFFHDSVKHEHIFEIYSKTDALIHIESFDQKHVKFTKYSLSTKIAEYLASGKPLIIFAPPSIACSKYITKYHSGLACSNKTDLEHKIYKVISDQRYRSEIAENALLCAERNHSVKYLMETIHSIFK